MSENNNATKDRVKKNAVGTDRTDASSLPRPLEQLLEEDLGEIDRFLTRRTSLADQLSYRACPRATRQGVYDTLAKDTASITDAFWKDDKVRKTYETKVELVNAADLLFRFFLPSRFKGPTVGKYWGALDRVLKVGD